MDVLGGMEQYNSEEGVWRRYTSLVTPRSGTRFSFLALVIITCGVVQVHRVRGQGVCAGRVQRHLQAALSGVLHPRTSWHQAKVAPGETTDYGATISKGSLGGRYAGASLQLLCGRPR